MTPTEAARLRRQHYWLVIAVRVVLLLMGLVLGVISDAFDDLLPTFVALVVIAGAASIPISGAIPLRMQPVMESVAAAVVISASAPDQGYFLPYLIAPALAAGLTGGALSAVLAVGLAGAALLIRSLFGLPDLGEYLSSTSQWVLISLAFGLLAAWVRRILSSQVRPADPSYEEAYRLLSQLRTVSRQLSGGLDAITLAQALLESLARKTPYAVGAVYARGQGGHFIPLAVHGAERVDWDVTTETAERPQRIPHRFDGSPGASAVLPMRVGGRSTGLVALEATTNLSDEDIGLAAAVVREAALRLETAVLFGEIRSIATVEERRRLAREIHDGIAQELASLGYLMDDLRARARQELGDGLEKELGALREELTRIISELRLSIFDLRSEVHADVGLGSALSDYVRWVGTGSSLTVHLILDEAPTRMSVETETELMRIAQEAITNVRRHAGAKNLWVTCRVVPPRALLRIEDDGGGMKGRRNDSYGIEIMRERAARIGATLSIRDRPAGGTTVEITIGDWQELAPADDNHDEKE